MTSGLLTGSKTFAHLQHILHFMMPRSASSASQGNSVSQLIWKFLVRLFASYCLSHLIVTFALKTILITMNRSFRDKLVHLTYRPVVIRITIPEQWTCECDAIHETQTPVVRGIAARPSESTGKSTGCESHKAA